MLWVYKTKKLNGEREIEREREIILGGIKDIAF